PSLALDGLGEDVRLVFDNLSRADSSLGRVGSGLAAMISWSRSSRSRSSSHCFKDLHIPAKLWLWHRLDAYLQGASLFVVDVCISLSTSVLKYGLMSSLLSSKLLKDCMRKEMPYPGLRSISASSTLHVDNMSLDVKLRDERNRP
ncbi:hypothetical protein FOL47_000876, partial [Perkinsus chesapeaki]